MHAAIKVGETIPGSVFASKSKGLGQAREQVKK
jgi:hypothetical protein